MTSYYTQIPTLDMRARATDLVIIGKVDRIIETDIETHENNTYVRTTFGVEIREILKGTVRGDHVAVEVLGGSTESSETPMQLPVREHETMVFMLSEAEKRGAWVPYLGSAFVVEDSHVKLGEHAAQILGALEGSAAAKIDISLDDVRKIVADAVRSESENRAPDQLEPLPIREMPTGHNGGGQDGAPESQSAED